MIREMERSTFVFRSEEHRTFKSLAVRTEENEGLVYITILIVLVSVAFRPGSRQQKKNNRNK